MSNPHRPAFMQRASIVLTTADRDRLSALLDTASEIEPCVARFLREEVDRAEIVRDDVAANSAVAMGSETTFIDHRSMRVRRARLVYPDEANGGRSTSVVTPIGSALLGLGPGQSIDWSENGEEWRLSVLEVRSSSKRENRPSP